MRNYSNGFVSKNKGCWHAVVNWQGPDGKQHRKTKSTGVKCYPDKVDEVTGKVHRENRGKQMAETFLRSWREELVAAERYAATHTIDRDTPFQECAEDYVVHKEASGTVREVTANGYRSHLNHIYGTDLGSCPIGSLTPRIVTEWEHSLVESGLSPATVSHIFTFAKQVCTHARRMGDIPSNPFDLVEAPRRVKRPVNALNDETTRQLMEQLDGFGIEPFAVAVKIALATGMRQAEVCALRFSDVDFSMRVIHVRHSLGRSAGTYLLSDPKTRASVRDIPMGGNLRSLLLERKEACREMRDEFGLPWSDSVYVVGNAITGAFYNPQVLGQNWRSFIRMSGIMGTQGIPPRFHDLRHSFATNAIAKGIDVKSVGGILGHSSCAMTLDTYASSLMDSKRAGMDQMDRVLG